MLTTAQKTKKIGNAEKRIAALQARVDRIAKLKDVSAELKYEQDQLALLRQAPVSDSTSTVVDVQTTHNAGAEVTATGALPAEPTTETPEEGAAWTQAEAEAVDAAEASAPDAPLFS